MRYWDASAVVPLLVRETVTTELTELLRHDPTVITWWGTEIECVSALARLEREGALPGPGLQAALGRLDELSASWHTVQPLDILRVIARRLLRTHALRAADSLQLAAAITAAEHRPGSLAFVCQDIRLNSAADREGFPVVYVPRAG